MIQIDDTLVSTDVIEKKFHCDLEQCKGACCVHGDSGAPLEEEEKDMLRKYYPAFRSFLSQEGLDAINKNGLFYLDEENDWVTMLVGNEQCAYSYKNKGISYCAIEKAWEKGLIPFQKPVSCHLYPIRLKEYKDFTAVNYDEWEICKPALILGEKKDISVYSFCKSPLIRKFGKSWYQKLEKAAQEYLKAIQEK